MNIVTFVETPYEHTLVQTDGAFGPRILRTSPASGGRVLKGRALLASQFG